MLNLNSILLSSEDPKRLADFYKGVIEKDPDMDDGGYVGFLVGKAFLTIGPHDKIKGSNPNPERILFNFETTDVRGEFKRITNLGGKVVADPYQMGGSDMWIATLEDPDGNYFQLISPWGEEK